jgi:excisionase family DNA binding protein
MLDVSEKQFFSPDEAAEFLGVHVQTIRGYIRLGKLPALRLAGERALRIKRKDLLALLEPFKPEET